MSDNTYKPTGTHMDSSLTAEEKERIAVFKQQWADAEAKGDKSGMDAAHAGAEAVRAGSANPYSGGADGSEYIPLSVPSADSGTGRKSTGSSSQSTSGYRAAALPPAQSHEAYISAIYAAQEDLALEQLKSQYEQNVLAIDNAAEKIPAEYMASRNSASSDSEIAKSAFNERAAAYGLNSGTGAQSTLSMNNALLGNLAAIGAAEADALSEIELSRVQLQSAYSSNITKAIAENNLEKAAALYKELVRLDEANYARALAQASENYKAYSSLK